MPTNEFDDLHGETLSEDELDEFLAAHGVGVLSLADGDDAYGVPISYGYDAEGGRLFFVFLRPGAESRKEEFAAATDNACFTLFNIESKHEWASAIIDGTLREVHDDEWDDLSDALERNSWHPDLFSKAEPTRGIAGWKLDIENASGRVSE